MPYQNISATLNDSQLDDIQKAIKTIEENLPFLVNLTAKERRTLYKMGDKSLAFVSNCVVTAETNPNILPPAFDLSEFKQDFELAQRLNEILVQLRKLTEEVDDTLVAVGSEAMQSSLSVYEYVKTAAKHQSGLKATAEQLGARFKAISRSNNTQKKKHETLEATV
jgi:hypothetical protein